MSREFVHVTTESNTAPGHVRALLVRRAPALDVTPAEAMNG